MNIIFDLGGVVFDWNPDKILNAFFDNDNDDVKAQVKKHIFQHPDWEELDRGTLDFEDAVRRGAERTQLPAAKIRQILNAVPESLTPISETVELLYSLKQNPNNKLYVLSNMHVASKDYLEKAHDFWTLFDGKVFSCDIYKIKPDPEIYAYLLDTLKLEACETVFIDDMPVNIEAASKFGIKTILFENAQQCREQLSLL